MIDPTIQRATLTDVEAVAPLFDAYRVFYGTASNASLARAFITERLVNEESIIFLATDAPGNALGFTQLYPSFSSARAGRIFILNDLFVSPAARRGGIAKKLLKAAVDFGRESGALGLTLETAATNTSAQSLYESMGWKRDESFWRYGLIL